MRSGELNKTQKAVVGDQVRRMLANSESFRHLSAAQRADIERNTIAVTAAIVAQGGAREPAPARRASGLSAPGRTGKPRHLSGALADSPPGDERWHAEAVEAGARGAGQIIREVNFTQFVAELVKGTFQAIVQSSMEQMKAYGELVRSVAMSLNEFRDANVSEQQGHENLVQRYPQVFQLNVNNGMSQAAVKDGADLSTLPNFQADLGLDEEITDLDDETIAEKLVPASRDSIARGRQKLLATMVLMGINRIIVTDGKINAKVRFNFSAHDSMTRNQTGVNYANLGEARIRQGVIENAGTALARESYQQYSQPIIQVQSTTNTQTAAELTASGQLVGEVSLNFRSETFPLEKMVDTDQMDRLDQAQRRGTTAAAAPAPAPPATAPASPTPAGAAH